MNKSEIEQRNIMAIIEAMPETEKQTCKDMIASLLMSVGDPKHGKTFMMAVAYVNTEIAVHSIRMGIVDPKGEALFVPQTEDQQLDALIKSLDFTKEN